MELKELELKLNEVDWVSIDNPKEVNLALGTCIFAIDCPQTAVLYVESSNYIEKTTEKEGRTWRYQIAFLRETNNSG